ncbi:hypothetical protein [Adhaeribacter aerolatus]|jgi:hypothetical protein|uniref:hypothetical protein n=1 Tax=Adhaeribacter aerolatus TaxID=670289 RepID=UPI0011BEF00C|nr:hypothetical protein [Adhaeribacter aerolatus]
MNFYFFFALVLFLIIGFAFAKWYYKRKIILFRSGDLIQERSLFGKSRTATLSKFDEERLSYIPDNGFDLIHRRWYWFYLIKNISFNERMK